MAMSTANHNKSIWKYAAMGANMGTTIKMFLPVSTETDYRPDTVESDETMPTGTETVLVVEDRDGVRRFACRTLRRLGYRTYDADDAAKALSVLQQQEGIDLLFSDIVMPGDVNGRELASLAATRRPGIKVLLATGMEPTKGDDVISEERFPLLQKPYSAGELARMVRTILDSETRS